MRRRGRLETVDRRDTHPRSQILLFILRLAVLLLITLLYEWHESKVFHDQQLQEEEEQVGIVGGDRCCLYWFSGDAAAMEGILEPLQTGSTNDFHYRHNGSASGRSRGPLIIPVEDDNRPS